MFPERDASKVKFFCETLLKPIVSSLSLGSRLIAGIGLQANKYGSLFVVCCLLDGYGKVHTQLWHFQQLQCTCPYRFLFYRNWSLQILQNDSKTQESRFQITLNYILKLNILQSIECDKPLIIKGRGENINDILAKHDHLRRFGFTIVLSFVMILDCQIFTC